MRHERDSYNLREDSTELDRNLAQHQRAMPHRRRWRPAAFWNFAIAVMAILLVSGDSQRVFAQSRGVPPSIPNVTKPVNYTDLLRNFKMAIEDGLLFNPEFFSDHTLLSFFGEGRVVRDEAPIDRIAGRVVGFSQTADPSASSTVLNGAVVYFWLKKDSHPAEAGLQIIFLPSKSEPPSFEDMEAVFGKEWFQNFDPRPVLRGQVQPPTAPHGNDVIIYDGAPRLSFRSEFVITFSSNARIARASAWLAEVTR